MQMRKIQVNLDEFPRELHRYLSTGTVCDTSGHSGAVTLYCGCYIKMDAKGALASEAAKYRRFDDMGMGARVLHYISADRDYLVTEAAPGRDLTHMLDDPEQLCRILAYALRRLHSQSVEGVPESEKMAQYRSAGSGFDTSCMLEGLGIRSREDARELIRQHGSRLKSDTLIHGDACLPNVLSRNGKFTAFIDVGGSGAGDRHIDLFWAVWSLAYNLKTEKYTGYFLDQYGRDAFDFQLLRTAAACEILA